MTKRRVEWEMVYVFVFFKQYNVQPFFSLIKNSAKMFTLNSSKISFLLVATFVFSCNLVAVDPAVEYVQVIENKSNVHLLLLTPTSTRLDSVIIPTGEEHTIFDIQTIGTIRGFQDCLLDDLGELSLEVATSDSLIVNIDPNQHANWQFTIFEETKNGGGACECRLVIDNQHIE